MKLLKMARKETSKERRDLKRRRKRRSKHNFITMRSRNSLNIRNSMAKIITLISYLFFKKPIITLMIIIEEDQATLNNSVKISIQIFVGMSQIISISLLTQEDQLDLIQIDKLTLSHSLFRQILI